MLGVFGDMLPGRLRVSVEIYMVLTIPGCFWARAGAGSNQYRLVRPSQLHHKGVKFKVAVGSVIL